jgi:hypothetical protein
MDRLFERLGYASQWVTDTIQSRASDVVESEEGLHEGLQEEAHALFERAAELLPDSVTPEHLATAVSAVSAWAASRYLSRGQVRWSRAVLAGVVGTLLYDVLERMTDRKDENPSGGDLIEEWKDAGSRYGGGIALALFYAAYLNNRLPGPAPIRGVMFGGLDVAALRFGGLIPLIDRVLPDLELPSGISGLARSGATTPLTVARHLAFGLGVGTVYGRG